MGYVVIHLWETKKGKLMTEKQEVAKVGTTTPALSKGQKFQVEIMQELENSMQVMDVQFTDYGKKCVVNAIGSLILHCQNNGLALEQINPILLRQQLQNVGLTELNMAGLPSEAYFDLRKTKNTIKLKMVDKKTGVAKEEEKEVYNIAIKPQGAGNEKLVRKYGVGLKKGTGLHQAILIHEGDIVTMPQYEGTTSTPLKIETRFENINNKIIGVAYVVEKEDGSEDYLIATREGIKPNIVAQIRQNTLYAFKKPDNKYEVDEKRRDEFYAQVDADAEKMPVDEFVNKYKDYVNPTYTSGGSRESMFLRKMKNNALKYYPKEYDSSYIKGAVEDMFEEKDESLNEKPKAIKEVDIVDKVEKEIAEEQPVANAPQDFDIIDAKVEEPKPTPAPAPEKSADDEEETPF